MAGASGPRRLVGPYPTQMAGGWSLGVSFKSHQKGGAASKKELVSFGGDVPFLLKKNTKRGRRILRRHTHTAANAANGHVFSRNGCPFALNQRVMKQVASPFWGLSLLFRDSRRCALFWRIPCFLRGFEIAILGIKFENRWR